eukprot:353380-Chlamydomonas_euryale.AAC.6
MVVRVPCAFGFDAHPRHVRDRLPDAKCALQERVAAAAPTPAAGDVAVVVAGLFRGGCSGRHGAWVCLPPFAHATCLDKHLHGVRGSVWDLCHQDASAHNLRTGRARVRVQGTQGMFREG